MSYLWRTALSAPERDLPICQMSSDQLSDYRRALEEYLRRVPEQTAGYLEMRACLADVTAEPYIREIIDHFSGRAGVDRLRPPARAGLDTARAGPWGSRRTTTE